MGRFLLVESCCYVVSELVKCCNLESAGAGGWEMLFQTVDMERDVMENTVQAGTPAKVSKCDVEHDIE